MRCLCDGSCSTITVSIVKLLHCVHVPGTPPDERRLFVQGSVTCDYGGWQLPLMVCMMVLVAVPFVTPFVSAWAIATPPAAVTPSGPLDKAGASCGE